MTIDPRTPVIVGVGQHVQRELDLDHPLDPVAFMARAVDAVVADAELAGVPTDLGAIRVVNQLSWRYTNVAWSLARRLGVNAAQYATTHAGGNTPQTLVNLTALDIASGRLDAALLVGGEAWRTRMRARREGVTLTWSHDEDAPAADIVGGELEMTHPDEAARGIYLPVQMYPMFETALRAAEGRSPADQSRRVAELWSRFSAVAASNPFAWLPTERTPEELATVTAANRMIGLPYPKAMNSNNDVDMAAALLMCSAGWATANGIARDRWVFPHAGTDCHEHPFVSNRWSLAEAPAVRTGGARAFELAGWSPGDVDVIDLYSCFPSAVQIGTKELGFELDQQLTRTGGLSFAGGPWNNYVMHGIATVVGDLRARSGSRGFVWANGGYLTKHSFGLYATEPPESGFRHKSPQAEIDALPRRALASSAEAEGAATIEAYTVMFDRNGQPESALAACLLPDGRRAWGTADAAHGDVTEALTDGEWVGTAVTLGPTGQLLI